MGKKTRLTLLILLLGLFTMSTVAFFFTSDYSFHGEEEAVASAPAGDLADGTYEGTAEGHNGPVTVEVTVEGGQITSVEILDHKETESLGDVAMDEVIASIEANGSTEGVDTVSGATVSAQALIDAVNAALAGATAGPASGDLADGTYQGSAEGYGGEIQVEVTVTDGAVSAIAILDHKETDGLGDKAMEELTEAIIANGSTDGVDTVSGATSSSEGFLAAVNDALSQAGGSSSSASDVSYTDGTYEAEVEGHNGPIQVEVVVESGAISAINILDHKETEGLGDKAMDETIAQIIDNNGTDQVEVVSGATVTSQALIDAVNEALKDAIE